MRMSRQVFKMTKVDCTCKEYRSHSSKPGCDLQSSRAPGMTKQKPAIKPPRTPPEGRIDHFVRRISEKSASFRCTLSDADGIGHLAAAGFACTRWLTLDWAWPYALGNRQGFCDIMYRGSRQGMETYSHPPLSPACLRVRGGSWPSRTAPRSVHLITNRT